MNGTIAEFLILITEGDLFADQLELNALFDLMSDMLPDLDCIEMYKLLLLPECSAQMLARADCLERIEP
jgi:hypothetical protein